MKVCSPHFTREGRKPRGCIEIDTGQRVVDFRKGIADVSKREAKAIVAAGGFLPSMSGTTRATTGYRCGECGFGTYFKRCGRCGGQAVKEGNE